MGTALRIRFRLAQNFSGHGARNIGRALSWGFRGAGSFVQPYLMDNGTAARVRKGRVGDYNPNFFG